MRVLCVILVVLSITSPVFCADDDDKTTYAGQIGDGAELARVVTAKKRTLEIQGGFSTKASRESYGKLGWDLTHTFNVGDTIDMEFHIGVKEAQFKLSTKSFPAPEPVLFLMKDGKEFQQLKFTKGAC